MTLDSVKQWLECTCDHCKEESLEVCRCSHCHDQDHLRYIKGVRKQDDHMNVGEDATDDILAIDMSWLDNDMGEDAPYDRNAEHEADALAEIDDMLDEINRDMDSFHDEDRTWLDGIDEDMLDRLANEAASENAGEVPTDQEIDDMLDEVEQEMDDSNVGQVASMRVLARFALRDHSPGEILDVLAEARVIHHDAFGITNERDAKMLFEITLRWASVDVILALSHAIMHVTLPNPLA